jgi:DNA polymerase-3 subunit epsilon
MATINILDPSNQIRTFEGVPPMKDLLTRLFADNNFVILDTETTGLDDRAEAVSIGVIDHTGAVLLDTLVKPTRPITADVTAINGITNEMLVNARPFNNVIQDLYRAVAGKTIVVYNAPYDRRIIDQSFAPYIQNSPGGELGMMSAIWKAGWVDIMAPYAEYWGDYSDWHHSYRWQKLTVAAKQQRVPVVNAHRAVGDCLLTLGVMKAVHAKVYERNA